MANYLTIAGGQPEGPPSDAPKPPALELAVIYAAFGQVMAAWQMVEHQFVWLLDGVLVGARKQDVLSSFTSTLGFANRLKIVDSILAAIDASKVPQWADLHSRLVRLGQERNHLTHAMLYFEPESEEQSRLFFGPFIRSNQIKGEIASVHKRMIKRDDLLQMAVKIEQVQTELWQLTVQMNAASVEAQAAIQPGSGTPP